MTVIIEVKGHPLQYDTNIKDEKCFQFDWRWGVEVQWWCGGDEMVVVVWGRRRMWGVVFNSFYNWLD
ncbi:hypothetical protein Hanom_Chr11g00981681 [Helianthus anomalus]